MKIELNWYKDPKLALTATTVIEIAAREYGIVLLPSSERQPRYWESLVWEVPNLMHQIKIPVSPGHEPSSSTQPAREILFRIKNRLIGEGLNIEVRFDGKETFTFIAALEQELAMKTRKINNAIDLLRKTRNWFKSPRLAEIRRLLES